jgi:copper-containing nitrite reductase
MRRIISIFSQGLKSNKARLLLTSGGLIMAGATAIASNNANKSNSFKKLEEEIKEGETNHHHKKVEAEPDTPYVPLDAARYGYNATTMATDQLEKKKEKEENEEKMLVENAILTYAPNVPPPITRKQPALVKVELTSDSVVKRLNHDYKYPFWRFGKGVPGPFIRARVGDTMEVTFTNRDESGMPHNIDFHSVLGPGGGSAVTNCEKDQTRRCRFKLFYPGLFIYHCSAAPVPLHIANGMYGLILVEPEEGMSKADKEFYVVQSEFYVDEPEDPNSERAEVSYSKGLKEQADIVVFNGKEGSLTEGNVLQAKVGDRVRIYFGNAGPNLTSSFHIIGSIFDKVYREGSLMNPPDRGIQTTLVGPGSASIFELIPRVPGTYTLIDHAIFRLDKGAVGFLTVTGPKTPGIYDSDDPPQPCIGCKLHA